MSLNTDSSRQLGRSAGPSPYRSIALLLVASAVVQIALGFGLQPLGRRLAGSLGAQIAGALTYTAMASAMLATGYVWYRYREGTANPETLFTLVGVSVLVLLLGTYTLHGMADLPVVPDPMTGVLNGTLGMVLLALGYATVTDLDIRTSYTPATAVPAAITVVCTALLAGIGYAVLFETAGQAGYSDFYFPPSRREISLAGLWWDAVVPALVVALGYGLLYYGVIQERLRSRLSRAGVVAAMVPMVAMGTLVSGLVSIATIVVASTVFQADPQAIGPVGQILGALVAPFFAVGVAALVASLASSAQSDRALSPDGVGVAVGVCLVGLPAVGLAVVSPEPILVAQTLVAGLVAGTAAAGYERAETVWVPVVGFATWLVLADPVVWRLIGTFV